MQQQTPASSVRAALQRCETVVLDNGDWDRHVRQEDPHVPHTAGFGAASSSQVLLSLSIIYFLF